MSELFCFSVVHFYFSCLDNLTTKIQPGSRLIKRVAKQQNLGVRVTTIEPAGDRKLVRCLALSHKNTTHSSEHDHNVSHIKLDQQLTF